MAQFDLIEIPFVRIGNRRGLTMQQIAESPWLADVVRQFPQCFESDPAAQNILFIEPKVAPVSDETTAVQDVVQK